MADVYKLSKDGNPILSHNFSNMVSSKNLPLIPSLKEPPSILAKREFFKVIKEDFSQYKGFDLNELINKIKENKDNCTGYYQWMYSKAIEIYDENDLDDETVLRNLCDMLDNAYLQIKCKRFVIDINVSNVFELISIDGFTKTTPENIININPMKNIRDFDDCIFDFRDTNGLYLPIYYRINQVIYTMDYGKYKNVSPINFAAFLWRDELKNDKGMKNIVILESNIIPEIYPKLLLMSGEYLLCSKNDTPQYCIHKQITIHDGGVSSDDKEYWADLNICQMTPNLATNNHCPMLTANPWLILKYLSYAWDMYTHRNSIMHKNSKRKAGYTHNKVHVASTDANEFDYRIVPLHTYYDNERKNHEWKGGHHSSPCEHERAASFRRIFDSFGNVKKIVPVKGCTVNAGNQKTEIINIKTPKNKAN